MATQITIVRPISVAGVHQAVGATPTVADDLAKLLVTKGDATYTVAPVPAPASADVFTSGVASATSTATTLNIAVPGLKATDVVQVTLAGQGAAEVITKAVNDSANARIVVTFSAAATASTTKVAYTVHRTR